MAADLVKFRSGDNEKAQDETVVLLDPGQVLFGLTRKEDGSLFGSIWYDVFDDKYNIVQRVPMGGANAAGSYITGALSIADKNGHAGDQVVIADIDEATLLLPKHICAEYFAADTSFDITHSPFNIGESRQYGNGFVITHPFESKQEGWLRLIGEDGSKNTTLELATRDSYSKDHKYNQVVIRQYDGNGNIIADQDKLLREAILLGVNGETYFPGPVTSARGFVGDLTGHASSATKAQYDWLDNDIAETYFASVEEKVSKAAYQLDFANGAGTILKTIFMPVADAVKAGLITADRDHPQTLTGQKILDEYGGIQIKAPSGFDYKGIQGSKNEVSTTIWFSKENVQGTPVYDNTFTYDSKKHLLKVQNVEGLISNAAADKENNQIDDHYFCYFETANDAASYTIWGMPDTGTKRDFHASPTGALEKNKLVKIVVPIATESKAGIITADKNNPQYLAGTKYLQGSFILNSVDGQFIGQYYNKANPKDGYWKLQGDKNDDSLLLETLTNVKNTYGKIVIQQKNGSNGLSKFELANIYGNTGLRSLSITDNGDGLNNTSPYVLYINTTRKGDSNQSYYNSVFINNIINTATTVYFGTMNGDSDALYYINDSNNPNAKKSTIVIKTGSTYQTFFAQFRSLYLDDDLYVGKGISNGGPLIQHGSTHLHDITHNHYFNGKKNDIEMGSWVTIDAKNTSTPNEVILTLGNKIAQGTLGNGKGFLRLYSHNNNYGQWSFNGQDFTPSHNIYFLNNYDKLTGWQNGIWGKVGKDDYWRVGGGATAESKGYLELSVANNNVESILVRKYADDFKNLGSEPDIKYEAALLDENGNTYFPKGLAINKNKSDSGYAGLSLYGDIINAQPMYGIIYRTMNGTNHGYTVDTNHYWATYFNIHSKTPGPYGEGWIFNNGTLDVASIDRLGNAQFNQICLNRRSDSSTQSLKQTHGRISWYSPTYYTWYDYMSEPSAGYAPTGATPSKIGNITSWARRSLIENASGYGWVWESCQNKASETPVAWLGLSSNDGRLVMHGKEIYYAGSKTTISMIRWIENTADANGHGIGIGGGGITIIGSGESANTSNFAKLTTNGETKVIPGNEILYLLSDSSIFLETNADSFSARLGLKIDTSGALIPVIAESPYDRGINIGSPTARWSNIYANVLRLQGPSSNPSATAGARIEFTYDDGSSRLQPVYISYTPNDSYRQPAGLKIFGGTNAAPAWLEVEGDIYANKSIRNLEVGGGLYWNPYVESATDGSDAASITLIKSGVAGGTELRISQMNDANDVINLYVPNYIYLKNKRAFTVNDDWLRINDNSAFSSGIYTGTSLIRTDNQFQVGGSGSKFYANSSGNGYFSNTLGIGGTNTSYKLYVNGTSYFNDNVTINGNLTHTGQLRTYGPLLIGSDVNGRTKNYIAFYGTTGDNAGSFNHAYIGENLYGGSESSELVLFKGNDMGNASEDMRYASGSGPDRIRHIAAGHLFQIYRSALSGTFATIAQSTVPISIFEVNQQGVVVYNEGTNTQNYPAKITLKAKDTVKGTTSVATIAAYSDHGTASYGSNLVISSGGNTLIQAGDGTYGGYANLIGTGVNQGENLYLTADGNIQLCATADTSNRKLIWDGTTFYPSINNAFANGGTRNYWSVERTQWLETNRSGSGSDGGISLYAGERSNYVIMFRQTSNQGTHGFVTADWATYFTMDRTTNRGWIFRNNGIGNVASINNAGHMHLNGRLSLASNWRSLNTSQTASSQTKLYFGHHSHDKINSGTYYIPWFGGRESVNGYGYGNTWTSGLYISGNDTNDNQVGYYLATCWDDAAAPGQYWSFTRGGLMGMGTLTPNYKLHVIGDSYTTGWSRAGNGFYCEGTGVHFTHNGSVGEIDIANNNEFLWGSSSSSLHFNYRAVSRGKTVTNYIWNAGSSTSWASHNMGSLTLNNGKFFFKSGDGTLKMYAIDGKTGCGNETIAIQSCFNNTDPETHNYVTQYPTRCVIALQPRGGAVNIGDAPNHSYKLYVNGTSYFSGLATMSTGSHNGIKIGNTYLTAIDGNLILQNNTAIRFGGDSWDWNVWAGLKYIPNSKSLYLGLADNNAFTANSTQTFGKLYLPRVNYIENGIEGIGSERNYKIVSTYTQGGNHLTTNSWFKIANVSGYFNFNINITGGWSTNSPSVATVNICNRNGQIFITQLSGFAGSLSSTIRLGKVSTDSWDVLVLHNGASSGYRSTQYYTFTGVGNITVYQPSGADGTSYSTVKDLTLTSIDGNLLSSKNYAGILDGRYVNVTGDTMTGNLTVPSIYASNWFRSKGVTGWYNETYGGGIYMQDSTWVRVYNNKLFYVSSTNQSAIHTAGGIDARGEIRSFAANGFRLCYGSKPVIFRNDGSNFYILISNNSNAGNNWITPSGGAHPLRIDLTTGYCYSSRMYSAVWNDYAEYRRSKEEEPGRVVMEDKFGICHRATTRLQAFAGVVSDTFGFSQGETKDAKTPLAVAGRVLVYPYQDPSNYQPGDCVCAAPDGTVDIMTREEVVQWPDRIVGTVSEIPDYEVWSDGKVKVNGRIWIKVK